MILSKNPVVAEGAMVLHSVTAQRHCTTPLRALGGLRAV